MIGHVAQSYLDSGMFLNERWLLLVMFNSTYCFHMPFFFLLSAFVYLKAYFDDSYCPKYEKLKIQLLNLFVLYLFYSVVYGLFRIAFSGYANNETHLRDILMIWARPIAEYWYLYVLIFLYLAFMIPQMAQQKPWTLLLGTGALCLLSEYLPAFWYLNRIFYYGFFFVIGILLARGVAYLENKYFVLGAATCAIALMAYFHGDVLAMEAVPAAKIFVAAGISLCVWFLFKKCAFLGGSSFLSLCGKHALEIYIIHGYFTAGNRVLLPMVGVTDAYLSIALNFMISLFLPLAAVFLTKKLGLYDWLFLPGKTLHRRISLAGKIRPARNR